MYMYMCRHARLDQFVDQITSHFHKHAKAKHEEHTKPQGNVKL